MYAVVRTGGKQYRVEHGTRLEVERLAAPEGAEVELRPVLVVDGDTVLATPSQLGDATVKVRVLGATKGPKISGFTYKPKTNNRRRWGHRQGYTLIEVTSIAAAGKTSKPAEERPAAEPAAPAKPAAKKPAEKAPAKKAPAKQTTAKKKAVKKATVKKATVKKATAKKATAKKTPAKKAATKTTKKSSQKKDES